MGGGAKGRLPMHFGSGGGGGGGGGGTAPTFQALSCHTWSFKRIVDLCTLYSVHAEKNASLINTNMPTKCA